MTPIEQHANELSDATFRGLEHSVEMILTAIVYLFATPAGWVILGVLAFIVIASFLRENAKVADGVRRAELGHRLRQEQQLAYEPIYEQFKKDEKEKFDEYCRIECAALQKDS